MKTTFMRPVAALFFATATSLYGQTTPTPGPPVQTIPVAVSGSAYFPPYRIASNLAPYVVASGDRLQIPGKERISVSGSIQFGPSGSAASAAQIVLQMPLKIRVDQGGTTLIMDRSTPTATAPTVQRDSDLLETLVEDTLEGLLNIQDSAGGLRHLGSNYRATDLPDQTIAYDIVTEVFPSPFHGNKPIAKTFWFNSLTKLLARSNLYTRSGGSR